MKKKLFSALFIMSSFFITSQVIIDTVSIGPGYMNQVWYSLDNDNQVSSDKSIWDIAFQTSGMGSSILINSVTGTKLWTYPNSDTIAWSNIDTNGLSTWTPLYNSDTTWENGAFSTIYSNSSSYDLGWGIYNSSNHFVTGDSLYIIKLANGNFKKIWIKQLANGIYNFTYADLNGDNLINSSIQKSLYSNKNFVYYSIQNNNTLDIETASSNWDLLFTQYTSFIPSAYSVTGILQNIDIEVAKLEEVSNPNTFNSWHTQTFKTKINEIGYDWKSYSNGWSIKDSILYFVKDVDGDVWKIIPIAFGGSSDGNIIFSKEKISLSNLNKIDNILSSFVIYPNPSENGNVNIIYDFDKKVTNSNISIYDINGKQVFSDEISNEEGLNIFNINTNTFKTGMYFLNINYDGKNVQQKLIIK